MKTMRLFFASSARQGRWWSPSRIMCTPWNTKRSGSSLKARMPLERKMFGPSFCVSSWIHGKNLSGSSGLSLEKEKDCMSSSWKWRVAAFQEVGVDGR